jgi:hypothetical protein
MINTLCAYCEFGVVRLEASTTHFQEPLGYCVLIDN